MNWIKINNRYKYSICENVVVVKGNQEKILFGLIIIDNKKIDFEMCLSYAKFIQFKNMWSLYDSIEYMINEKLAMV